ncbi:MAG: 6-phosphofructokinase, partial [Dehalococcoidia bacterium]|nr:6-phosphofructokinase [Dehalococcoidia bacterium]
MDTIGLLTSGGDAPGMNACIRAVVRSAIGKGLRVFGIRDGYRGLLAGTFEEMGLRSVGNILQRGGTILGTSRCEEFKTEEGCRQAADLLRRRGVDGLVVIGGDGTFRGALDLHEQHGIPVVGVPGTIDNDVVGTDYTLGFDTAVNTALEAIDRLRDTADSLRRVFIVEVMGHGHGYLALYVGLVGGADAVLLPEVSDDVATTCRAIWEGLARGKRSSIVVVAEGAAAGGTFEIAEQLMGMADDMDNVDTRVCVLGHIQRGGRPSASDRLLGSILGNAAVDAILSGVSNQVVGRMKGKTVITPLRQVVSEDKGLPMDLLELM